MNTNKTHAEKTQRTLILVGGGHSHALLLKKLSKRPIANLSIILISPNQLTPYSGMLPGLIAGHYDHQDIHIDLAKLSNETDIQFIEDRARSLSPKQQELTLSSGKVLSYDLISFDTGATPDLSIPGAAEHSIPVKPIDDLYARWQDVLSNHSLDTNVLEKHALDTHVLENKKLSESKVLSVIGSGAAGVELILAFHHRLKHLHSTNTQKPIKLQLIVRGSDILTGYPPKVVQAIKKKFKQADITVHNHFDVAEVKADKLVATNGSTLESHIHFWCTQVKGAEWLKDTQLDLSEQGFIRVGPTLQSQCDDTVFAVGDVCHFDPSPLPKAGVYAVRMADTLDHNIRAKLAGSPLKAYQPQTDFLSLLACGDKTAIGCKQGVTIKGRWVWKLKNRIDQKFMGLFK